MAGLAARFKGLVLRMAEIIMPKLSADVFPLCAYIKRGEFNEATRVAIETNKHIGEAQKVRFAIMTALQDAYKNDTKITLPELTW